jgi:hypothetical protein
MRLIKGDLAGGGSSIRPTMRTPPATRGNAKNMASTPSTTLSGKRHGSAMSSKRSSIVKDKGPSGVKKEDRPLFI